MLTSGWAPCASTVSLPQARVLNHDLQHNNHDGGIMNKSSSLLIYICTFHVLPHLRSRDSLILEGFLLLMLAPLTRITAVYVLLTGFALISLVAPLPCISGGKTVAPTSPGTCLSKASSGANIKLPTLPALPAPGGIRETALAGCRGSPCTSSR
jgi:hypothetical protein